MIHETCQTNKHCPFLFLSIMRHLKWCLQLKSLDWLQGENCSLLGPLILQRARVETYIAHLHICSLLRYLCKYNVHISSFKIQIRKLNYFYWQALDIFPPTFHPADIGQNSPESRLTDVWVAAVWHYHIIIIIMMMITLMSDVTMSSALKYSQHHRWSWARHWLSTIKR